MSIFQVFLLKIYPRLPKTLIIMTWYSSDDSLPTMQETRVQSLGQEDPLEKEIPTPVFLPGKSHGRGAWWAKPHGVAKS